VAVDSIASLASLAPPPDEAIHKDLKAALRDNAGYYEYCITVASQEQSAVYMCSKGAITIAKAKSKASTSLDVDKH